MGAIIIVVVTVVAGFSAPAGVFSATTLDSEPDSYSTAEARFDDEASYALSRHDIVPGSASNARPTSTFLRSLEEMGVHSGPEEAEVSVPAEEYRV